MAAITINKAYFLLLVIILIGAGLSVGYALGARKFPISTPQLEEDCSSPVPISGTENVKGDIKWQLIQYAK